MNDDGIVDICVVVRAGVISRRAQGMEPSLEKLLLLLGGHSPLICVSILLIKVY